MAAEHIITLEAVYDSSDLSSDYYSPDTPIKEWFVCEIGTKRVTEEVLRQASRLLPLWLQSKAWSYSRGEKYSMSDHPYGQLRIEQGLGIRYFNHGQPKNVALILSATTWSIFRMNHKADEEIPWSAEDFGLAINERDFEKVVQV